jgi:hypothetical protein
MCELNSDNFVNIDLLRKVFLEDTGTIPYTKYRQLPDGEIVDITFYDAHLWKPENLKKSYDDFIYLKDFLVKNEWFRNFEEFKEKYYKYFINQK